MDKNEFQRRARRHLNDTLGANQNAPSKGTTNTKLLIYVLLVVTIALAITFAAINSETVPVKKTISWSTLSKSQKGAIRGNIFALYPEIANATEKFRWKSVHRYLFDSHHIFNTNVRDLFRMSRRKDTPKSWSSFHLKMYSDISLIRRALGSANERSLLLRWNTDPGVTPQERFDVWVSIVKKYARKSMSKRDIKNFLKGLKNGASAK